MWIVTCPHCSTPVVIEQVNCAIFRHAAWRTTLEPVPPHATKTELETWASEGKIHGCARPFRLIPRPRQAPSEAIEYEAVACDYL